MLFLFLYMTDLKHLLCFVHKCRGGGAQTSSTSSVVFINEKGGGAQCKNRGG